MKERMINYLEERTMYIHIRKKRKVKRKDRKERKENNLQRNIYVLKYAVLFKSIFRKWNPIYHNITLSVRLFFPNVLGLFHKKKKKKKKNFE